MKKAYLFGLLWAVSLLFVASTAQAHAVVVGSNPGNGSRLAAAPTTVEVRFNEPVNAEFNPIVVLDQAGLRVDVGDGRVLPQDPSVIIVTVKPPGTGYYSALYRVTSLDGHPVEGTIGFAVGDAAVAPSAAPANTTKLPPAVGFAHGAAQMAGVLLAGLGAFLILVWFPTVGPERMASVQRWAIALFILFVAAGLTELPLYAVRASGDPISLGLFWRAMVATRFGHLWLTRIGLGLVSALGTAFLYRAGRFRWFFLVPGAMMLLTFSLQSHAMATQRQLPVYADWLHLIGIAPWVGGLVGFALVVWPALRSRQPEERQDILRKAVPRFSVVAIASVVLLTGTGIYSSLLHIPSWEGLFDTNYGRMLCLKVALLIPVLLLGAFNLSRKGAGAFRRLVLVEVLLMVGIFGAAGFLTSMPPAQAELLAKMGPFEQTVTEQGLQITLRVEPTRVGNNQDTIVVKRIDGTPEQGAGVNLLVTMIQHDMGQQNLDAKEEAPGRYRGEEVILGMHGTWHLEVVVLTKQGREIRHTFLVVVPDPTAR